MRAKIALAIDQTSPVRTSRSTVGTMTELNDHLKLLFARAAVLHCRGCGAPVRCDSPRSILADIREAGLDRIMVTFEVPVPERFTPAEVVALLAGQGYTRVHREHPDRIEVVADRLRLGDGSGSDARARAMEAIERGHGRHSNKLSSARRCTACFSGSARLSFSRSINFQRTAGRFPASGKPIRPKSGAAS